MAQTLKFKRGNSTNFGSLTLGAGEPAFVLDTGKLYVGDGTNKVLINPDIGTVSSAGKLSTARTISLTGDVTGSTTFDGSADKAIAAVLKSTGTAGVQKPKVTTDEQGRVTSSADLTAVDIPSLTMSKISDAGTAAKANTGTASGNVPVLDTNGKLNTSVLPAIAITDTFVVANQAAMLALTQAEVGDIAVRTDLNKCFILKTAPYSTLANWQELLTPTDTVQSVNGQTGTVVITDITGNAGTATALQTPRTIHTNLASTSSASFNGSANITPGVTGTLPIGNGGTGLTSAPSLLTDLGSAAAASPLQASPRPGVTGTLAIGNGGTGATTAAAARTNLGCLGTTDIIDGGTF